MGVVLITNRADLQGWVRPNRQRRKEQASHYRVIVFRPSEVGKEEQLKLESKRKQSFYKQICPSMWPRSITLNLGTAPTATPEESKYSSKL